MIETTTRCDQCREEFTYYPDVLLRIGANNVPKTCPKCKDRQQGRPSPVVERSIIKEFKGVRCLIPDDYFEVFTGQAGDMPCLRTTIKGNSPYWYDIPKEDKWNWKGRLDIYVQGVDVESPIPTWTDARVMYVQHKLPQRVDSHIYLVLAPGLPNDSGLYLEHITEVNSHPNISHDILWQSVNMESRYTKNYGKPNASTVSTYGGVYIYAKR